MKKLFVIICSLFVGIANADNVITSKEYVDTAGAALQPQISAKNTNTVLTYPAAGTDTPGEKAIYDASAAYATQSDALVTAGAFNSAVQNALESEFVCVEWQGSVHDNAHCLLYEVRGATQTQNLPAGYTQLEYLESTGTQYIDMGVAVKQNTNVSFDYQFAGNVGNHNWVFGQIAGAGEACMGYRRLGGLWWFKRTDGVDLADNLKHRVVYSPGGKVFKDDTEIATRGNSFVNQPGLTMLLFAERNDKQVINKGSVKIYYFQIHEGNTLVRDFIPAQRDSDGKLGMYDTVSNTFFTNAGTGEFIAGPAVSSNLYLPSGN